MTLATTNSTIQASPTFGDALIAFVPGLSPPPGATEQTLIGVGLIVLIQFTTTYNHPYLPYLRLALAIPTAAVCWDYGLVRQFEPKPTRYAQLAMALMGVYGIMKLIEICVVGFNNKPEDWPKWVSKKEKDKAGKPKVIPFTPTIPGRLLYSVDLLSVQGSSWYSGRVWDFAPAPMAKFDHPSRVRYFVSRAYSFVLQYLAIDVLETCMSTRKWDTRNPYPITSLPTYYEQAFFALCVCIGTGLSITKPFTFHTLNTMMLGAPPSAWPPIFHSPFSSTSLAEFWTHKWHALFRRVFERLSAGILALIPTTYLGLHSRAVKLIRAILIFSLSLLLHLLLMWALPTDASHPYPSFWNTQAMKFFLAQPLGLFLEFAVVFPLTEKLPVPVQREVRRAAAWCWLLWSGRFWSDVWISRGLWNHQERFVIFSPVRWLLRGTWVV